MFFIVFPNLISFYEYILIEQDELKYYPLIKYFKKVLGFICLASDFQN